MLLFVRFSFYFDTVWSSSIKNIYHEIFFNSRRKRINFIVLTCLVHCLGCKLHFKASKLHYLFQITYFWKQPYCDFPNQSFGQVLSTCFVKRFYTIIIDVLFKEPRCSVGARSRMKRADALRCCQRMQALEARVYAWRHFQCWGAGTTNYPGNPLTQSPSHFMVLH